MAQVIELAKTFERRRCGHHPNDYPEPLDTKDCLKAVIDPKDSGTNRHRYVVACQDEEVRRMLREVKGVPLIYIKRSVMIMEPMADQSVSSRLAAEKRKFRSELRGSVPVKRKREEEDEEERSSDDGDSEGGEDASRGPDDNAQTREEATATKPEKKKKAWGTKGPNPLSVKKRKKESQPTSQPPKKDAVEAKPVQEGDAPAKKKRKRRQKRPQGQSSGDTEPRSSTAGMDTEG
jgi:U3 small nucleolar RNA-associated protein 23